MTEVDHLTFSLKHDGVNLEILAAVFGAIGDRAYFDAQLVAARDGYTSQAVTIYAPDGTALALSQQSMLVFG